MTVAPALSLSRGPSLAFGSLNILSAAVIALGVFEGLPERYGLVDAPALVLVLLLAVSGVALLARSPWSARAAVVASATALAAGLLLVTALALSASYLAGVYGPVGRGGAIIFILVIALAIPYLIALPLLELLGLRGGTPKAGGAGVLT
jgi:hypothetical protein